MTSDPNPSITMQNIEIQIPPLSRKSLFFVLQDKCSIMAEVRNKFETNAYAFIDSSTLKTIMT